MLFVGIGGILGSITRYLLGKWIMSKTSSPFPFGTWMINITGSFLLGILFALQINNRIPEWLGLLGGIGYLGAYTTFSTFGYETIQLLIKGNTQHAVLYVFTSVTLGILFAWFGGFIVLFLIANY